jgi:hypothetical protein
MIAATVWSPWSETRLWNTTLRIAADPIEPMYPKVRSRPAAVPIVWASIWV